MSFLHWTMGSVPAHSVLGSQDSLEVREQSHQVDSLPEWDSMLPGHPGLRPPRRARSSPMWAGSGDGDRDAGGKLPAG